MLYPPLQSRQDLLAMLDGLTQARQVYLARCRKLNTVQLHDPVIPGTWSLLQNLQHLAWAEEWLLAWIQVRPEALPPDRHPPLPALEFEALEVALDEAHASVIAFVKNRPEEVLREKCLYGQNEQTVGGILFHLLEHEIHHRALILYKLGRLEKPA